MRCLKAAIAALGPNPDATVLKTLQDALQAARSDANVPPVGVRLDSCPVCGEARRRLAKAEEDFNRVQEESAKLAAELSEGAIGPKQLGPPPPPNSSSKSGNPPSPRGDPWTPSQVGQVEVQHISGRRISIEETACSTQNSIGDPERFVNASAMWLRHVHGSRPVRNVRIEDRSFQSRVGPPGESAGLV